ncbi:hypothetical protein ACFQ6N_25565 [Kitasatospora sp. NPDC056446]|uniref:hypothetical protein n=1 Tax=Kitasatospora sp. NPDC056446 TaxID=3345819 RepID=UPI0036978670
MARTGSKGRGTESADLRTGAVYAALTAAIDAWLLSRIWRWAGEQTTSEYHGAVEQTAALFGIVGFAALLGLAVAGKQSTPQRRWRCAMFGALTVHSLIPLSLIVLLLTWHPTFVF